MSVGLFSFFLKLSFFKAKSGFCKVCCINSAPNFNSMSHTPDSLGIGKTRRRKKEGLLNGVQK